MGNSEYIIDVSESTFQEEVIERSKKVPVMVDFWAAWCGPCRVLGPTLERVTEDSDGALILAKVDVDQNQGLAQRYNVSGIPAVKIFRNGKVVEEFVGVRPEPEVRRIIKAFAPSEIDRALVEAQSLAYGNRWDEAEAAYQKILTSKPAYVPAVLELGRLYLATGRGADAQSALQQVPSSVVEYDSVQALLPLARLMAATPNGTDSELDAMYDEAALSAREQRFTDALDCLLDILRRDRKYRDGEAKQAVLAVLEHVGEDPQMNQYRRKLASVLF